MKKGLRLGNCVVYFEKNSPVKYLTYNCEDESQVFFSGLSGTH